MRILRRNAPSLTLERQWIGRRADFGAHAIAVAIRPGLRSARDWRRRRSRRTGRWPCPARGSAPAPRTAARAPATAGRHRNRLPQDARRQIARQPRRAHRETLRGQLSQPDAAPAVARKYRSSASKRACICSSSPRAATKSRKFPRPVAIRTAKCRSRKSWYKQRENFKLEFRDAAVVDPFTAAQLAQAFGNQRLRHSRVHRRAFLGTPAPPARRCTGH